MKSIFWFRGVPAGRGPWLEYPEGVVAVANVASGVFLVMYVDAYAEKLHTYLDLWVGAQQVASSDDRTTWSALEKWLPRHSWPASAFVWAVDAEIPMAAKLEHWAQESLVSTPELIAA